MSYRVGQVVVCVDASGIYEEVKNPPVEGGVYTIRSFSVGPDDELGLRLAEIVNPMLEFEIDGVTEMDELAFLSYRFRPAKETSLEVFDAALKGLPLPVEEA